MDKMTVIVLVVGISEILAIFLIWSVWRTSDFVAMKIALSVLALIPVVGFLGALWVHGFPSVQPSALQNKYRYSTDVFNRWRHVFEEKDERKKKRSIQSLLEKGHDDEGPLGTP